MCQGSLISRRITYNPDPAYRANRQSQQRHDLWRNSANPINTGTVHFGGPRRRVFRACSNEQFVHTHEKRHPRPSGGSSISATTAPLIIDGLVCRLFAFVRFTKSHFLAATEFFFELKLFEQHVGDEAPQPGVFKFQAFDHLRRTRAAW